MTGIASILAARELARHIGAESAAAEGVAPSATFADLYAYARSGDPAIPPALARDLASIPRLRDDLRALLRDLALYRADRVAAASSGGTMTQRRGDGFSLDLKPSRTGDGQVYALVILSDPDRAPRTLFIQPPDGALLKVPLPDAAGARLQVLFEPGDPALAALRDPASEIFLV
ncbi:MAG: hypothetical protein RJQ21_19095 [Rhodospirillales bacterium]